MKNFWDEVKEKKYDPYNNPVKKKLTDEEIAVLLSQLCDSEMDDKVLSEGEYEEKNLEGVGNPSIKKLKNEPNTSNFGKIN